MVKNLLFAFAAFLIISGLTHDHHHHHDHDLNHNHESNHENKVVDAH